ncbi:MAG: histidine kinase [Bacteroidia bacterium]
MSVFFLLNAWLGLNAQDFNFRHLSVAEGLSQSAVLCLAQDEMGYIWAGTADGLNRYNGYEFIHFRNRPGEANSISDNFIYSIEPTSNGNLWVGTFGGGLNYYNANKNEFTRFRAGGDKGQLRDNDIYSILDADSILLVGTASGLHYSLNHKDFEYVYLNDSFFYIPYDITVLKSKDVIVASDYGLNKWQRGNKHLISLSKDADNFRENEISVYCVYELNNGEIWVGTDDGIHVFDSEFKLQQKLKPQLQGISKSAITSIFQDAEGNVWVGSNGSGMAIYNPASRLFRGLEPDDFDDFSISDGSITDVIQDKSGVVWIGTYNGGINVYDRFINQFRLYQHRKGSDKGLSESRVFAIYETEQGDVWVGTDGGGLDYVDHTINTEGDIVAAYYDKSKRVFEKQQVWVITDNKDGKLWIGTIGDGLYLFDPKNQETKNWRKNSLDKTSISDDSIYSMKLDSRGVLWIGTDRGINAFNRKTEEFTSYQINPDDRRVFSSNTVLAIEEDAYGNIWAGTFGGGIAVINPSKGIVETHLHSNSDTNSLSYDKIMSIHKDQEGVMWIGTFGGGFNIYDGQSKTFNAYTELDGLPNDVIYGFLEDESGYMWMSTNNGLSAFNIKTGHFRNFDASCNLQSNEFNQGAFFKGKTGRFYFGGINGLNSFIPEQVKINNYKPPVKINAFSSPGNLLSTEIENGLRSISLDFESNNVFFDFVAFNYVNSHLNKYRYKLEGLNEDWIEAGKNRTASFTNLDPGDYTFKVQAANNDGVWNTTGAQVEVNVLSPFYMKWWFQPMLFIMAVSIVALIAFLIVKTVRSSTKQQLIQADLKLAETEKEGLKYRLTSLRAQMDPHFIFNSLNSIQHFITRNDKDSARGYLSKFAKLMRLILNSSREETISLAEEIDTLKLYIDLERLRFDYKFDYKIQIDDNIDPDEVDVPTMLLQPYIENAIIHGLKNKVDEQGLLKMNIYPVGNEGIKVEIEDNGIGRKKAAEIRSQKLDRYKSLGMQVTQDRLKLWSTGKEEPTVSITDLFDEDKNPVGTRVEVFIKVSLFD